MPIILDQHVGGSDEATQHRLSRLALEVECQAALVAVHHHEGRGLAIDVGRQRAAHVVAARKALDLDYVRAHIGEH